MESEGLRDAEATSVKEREQSGIACIDCLGHRVRADSGGEFAGIRFGERAGVRAHNFWSYERAYAGIFACVSARQIVKESTECGDAPGTCCGAEAGIVLSREPGAKVGWTQGGEGRERWLLAQVV